MHERSGGEPTLQDVQAEFAGWRCWRDTSGLYYARRTGAPPQAAAEVKGEDPLDLRDQINRAEALGDH